MPQPSLASAFRRFTTHGVALVSKSHVYSSVSTSPKLSSALSSDTFSNLY